MPGEHKSSFPTVSRTIAEDKKAHEFLNKLGLRKPDTAAEVLEHTLPKYDEPAVWQPRDEAFLKDLELVVEAWNTDSSKTRNKLQDRLSVSYIIPTVNPLTAERVLTKPGEAYFPTRELIEYFTNSHSVRFVEQIFHEQLDQELRRIFHSLGVSSAPRRLECETNLSNAELRELRYQRRTSRTVESY